MHFWIVDVFASSIFEGNAAAVCLLEKSFSDVVLQKIAREFNLHEIIFITPLQNQHFQIKIFNPLSNECAFGHSLLAAAHVLWHEIKPESIDPNIIYFDSSNGIFMMSNKNGKIMINTLVKKTELTAAPDRLINALGVPPIAVSKCGYIYVVEMFNTKHVLKLEPDIAKLCKILCDGIVVTAEGGKEASFDFISRFFVPSRLNEDPVTLWNHCFLGPYWANKLRKTNLTAMQRSDRGGLLEIECSQDQVKISGECVTAMSGSLRNISDWNSGDTKYLGDYRAI
ncbi:MAG: PhzF family phenazine biosynthesis protein [Holosporales bacterium]|jgi:PhzF family phenazine biosynthesis protein|nr:PhzF family phenazine biosynthesis protein [Holosporales bacterium]